MGKLEAVRTTESLAELVEKNGILTVKQLEQAKKACQESPDLRAAARRLVNEKLITLWQANQLLKGVTGLMRGKFKLLDELGAGSLGRVFLAEHGQLGRRVVLRTLSGRHKNDPAAIKNFLSQARDVAALDHRNLIHIYDIGNEADQYYVVTEYAEGTDLEKWVTKRGPLPIDRAADFIRQAAAGLAHAHERGVWHCELKPSNLLIDQQNTLKILDIGVAKLSATVETQPEETAVAANTTDNGAFFRAPEESARKNEGGTAADIYSLGAVLYYLLSGRPPMARSVDGKWARDEQLVPLESLRKDVPEEIRDLCATLLAEDPTQRPQSANEVAKLIETWQATQTDESAVDAAASTTAPVKVPVSAGAGAFTPKSGPPPIRKPLPKARLLANKSSGVDAAETPSPTDSSESIADSSAAVSIDVKKLAAKSQKSDTSEGNSAAPFSIDVDKPVAKNKKTTPSENVPAPAEEEPSFSINVGKPTTKGKKATSSEAVPAPAKEEPAFSVSTGKPAAKGKKPIANESVAIANDESVDEPTLSFDSAPKSSGTKGKTSTKTATKKKSSKAGGASLASKLPPKKILIVAGSAAAVFMVLLLSGVTYWFMSGGKAKTVAKVDPKAAEVDKEEEAKTEEKKMAEETPAVTEEKAEPKVEEPAKKEETPAALAGADTKKPEVPEPPAATPPSEPPAAKPPVTALKPETPEPKPEPAKPMEVVVNTPPPPKPPVVDPFVGFSTDVELPSLGTDTAPNQDFKNPLELGTLKIDAKALCYLQLLNNDFAIKGGKQKYVIEAGDGGTARRDWDIFFREAAAENGGTKIAAIGLHDDKLTFAWAPEATTQKASAFLCNCILQIAAGPKSRSVSLRKVMVKDPYVIDLNKPADKKETWKVPFAPDPKKIQIRFYIDGLAAKHRFDPKNSIDADKDMTLACFGETDTDLYLKLRIAVETKRDIDVTFSPYYQLQSMQKPEKLTASLLKSLVAEFKYKADAVAQQITVGKAQMGARPAAQQQQLLAQAEEQVRVLRQSETQAGQLTNLTKAISGTTKIHYEVIYKTDSKELVLITTNPPNLKDGKK